MPELDIIGVSKLYGNIAALDNVTLHVEDKEYVCVIGPSGCGKSTLIKCIAGIIQPDRGEILIDSRLVNQTSIEDRKIGYVFQDIALFPHMTVRNNLAYGLAVRNAGADKITRVTNEMLDLVKMRERSKSYPLELSGGAQQKVAVARAIATGSFLFLLDEPLGALDALVRAELRYELRRLASDLGLTVIHVTHDQEEALSIADRLVIMKRGRIIETGKPADVYFSPKSLFAENFVGETNLLEGKVVETDEMSCVVDFRGRRLRAPGRMRKQGERVVVAVRPESIQLAQCAESRTSDWRGRVEQVTFLGSTMRYEIEVADGLKLVTLAPSASEQEFHVGESVDVLMGQGKHMLLFDYPAEGLEKEVALE
jgi:ABC-type Fe3+/spermidine/putrescine transport system ATPase subunit